MSEACGVVAANADRVIDSEWRYRERVVLAYAAALGSGDWDTIQCLLRSIYDDLILERRIVETEIAYFEEAERERTAEAIPA